nr:unnamed protein product [Callosobruchus chinensis]
MGTLFIRRIKSTRTSVYPHYSVVLNTENLDSPMSLQKFQSLRRSTYLSQRIFLRVDKIDERCLNYFPNEAALTSRSICCENINDCKISFPKNMILLNLKSMYISKGIHLSYTQTLITTNTI